MKNFYLESVESVPELKELDKEDLAEVLTLAFYATDDGTGSANGRIEECTEGCAIGAAIGLAYCLPSLAAAGWGYFICGASVATSTLACCYGPK
jgi:hypothetical protein